MKCSILQLTTPRKLKTFHFLYHTTNVFAIFLPLFTQYHLKFLIILAKRFADEHDIPYSSRYFRNNGPTNVFAIFLPLFTQHQLKFLVILAKRFADEHDIPYSSRYFRNIGPFFAYFSLSLPQPGSTIWTYCVSYTTVTGYLPRGKAAGPWR
jgi:hypothetical protein